MPNASFAIAPLPFLLLASPAVATRALSLALGINAGQTTRELTPPEQSKPRELLSNTGLRMLQTTTSSGIARSSAVYNRRGQGCALALRKLTLLAPAPPSATERNRASVCLREPLRSWAFGESEALGRVSLAPSWSPAPLRS